MATPKERRQAKTRQAILDAARRIITEKGIDGLSMRALARRIDYSPAGLYEYFGGKEEIIAAVCAQGQERLYAAMAQVDPDLDDRATVRELGAAYLAFALANPDYYMLMFTFAPPLLTVKKGVQVSKQADLVAEIVNQKSAFHLILDAIERGLTGGTFSDAYHRGAFDLALNAWAVVHGLAMLWLTQFHFFNLPFEPLRDQVLDNFLDGITGSTAG